MELDSRTPLFFETRRERVTTRLLDSARTPAGADRNNLSLVLTGEVSTVALLWDDGEVAVGRVGDNAAEPTVFDATLTWRARPDLDVALNYQAGYPQNSSAAIGQRRARVDSARLEPRHAQVSVRHARWGKLSVGKGNNATDTLAQYDLSGTESVLHVTIADNGGGFRLRRRDGTLSPARVVDAYPDFDGDRMTRLRYDRSLGGAFQISLSRDTEGTSEAALRYSSGHDSSGQDSSGRGHTARRGGARFEGGIGLRRARLDTAVLGSATAQLLETRRGHVEAVVAGGYRWTGGGRANPDPLTLGDLRDSAYAYTKLGWRGDLWALGETTVSVDARLGRAPFAELGGSHAVGAQVAQALGTDAVHATLGVRRFVFAGGARGGAAPRNATLVQLGTIARF